ncbi:MAG: ATP-binding protein [Phycisphaerae bacterium]|nr:ATP-binding protein [Phycisphaerae bacterium]
MSVALPTDRTKPAVDLSQQTILLYGSPKIGKSSLASRFPEALFFECEPGLNQLEVFKIPTYSWEDFLAACKLVAAGNHRFKTIVIDTVDNAFKYCSDHVCGKNSIEYEGDMAHGKGWALVKNEWHRVLTRLASLPYGLMLISHAQDKTVETRTGQYTKTQPSLPDRARGVVLGLVDMILFCDATARKDAAGNLTVERVIRTKPHPTYEAGDRTGRLPEQLPLDFNAFAACFAGGTAALPTAAPGVRPGTGPASGNSNPPGSTPNGKVKS